ncbi:MAG: TolC family protein [Rugosibacter sp.]|nr:TolC family protein [Rugosibacter sp.]
MKITAALHFSVLLSLSPFMAWADDTAYADLPPAPLVRKALEVHPDVVSAQAGLAGAAGERERLQAGPYEPTLHLGSQRRRDKLSNQTFGEQEIGLESGMRLPGKVALDDSLGELVMETARQAHSQALRQTARLLLKSWFDPLREHAAASEWRRQAELLSRQAAVVKKRVDVGDAALLDQRQAEAQRDQALAQLAQAELRAALATDELMRHFPGLSLPAAHVPAAPQALEGNIESWRERILAHDHELQLAQAASRQSRLLARRADADRLPDPTLGLFTTRERDGQERVLGLQLSIPLPGGARSGSARVASSAAEAAAAHENAVRARLETGLRALWRQAQSNYNQWQRLTAVAGAMETNADALDRAWRLGEGQFSDLSQARRLAIEARLAASQAQFDANEARYRLLLDAGDLWSD